MKFFMLLSFSLLISSVSHAKSSKNTSVCDEVVANKVIDFLEQEEPTAELHIIKNAKGEVIGLVDARNTFPTIEFVRTMKLKKNTYENVFQYDTVIIYADYTLSDCNVFNLGLAQDDQD